MGYPVDLLEQAVFLAYREKQRPRQASLRRASSGAYYALFHLLIAEAVQFVPAKPDSLRNRAARAFHHGEMRQVCQLFSRHTLAGPVAQMLPNGVSAELFLVAAFISLQERRHSADYDMAADFSRTETIRDIEVAQDAFVAWRRVRNTPEGNVFLTALAFGARWSK